MFEKVKEELENEINFDYFSLLESTQSKIEGERGVLYYLPIKFPIPFENRILQNMFSEKDIKILSTPTTKEELKEKIYITIRSIIKTKNISCGIMFCPKEVVDCFDDIPGSKFLEFKKISITDSRKNLQKLFKKVSNFSIESQEIQKEDFSLFVNRMFFCTILNTSDINIRSLEKKIDIKKGYFDYYIPYKKLKTNTTPLSEYFLSYINLKNPKLFYKLDDQTRRNVYIFSFYEKYGFLSVKNSENVLGLIKCIKNMDQEIIHIFRSLSFEYLIKGDRFFDLSINDFETNRKTIEKIQKNYKKVGLEDKKINIQNPIKAGENLQEFFIYLFYNISSRTLKEFLRKARNQFFVIIRQIEEYNELRQKEVINRFLEFNIKLHSINIIRNDNVIENYIIENEDRWKEIFVTFAKMAKKTKMEKLFDFYQFKTQQKSISLVKEKEETNKEIQNIKEIKANPSNIDVFIHKWTKHILDIIEDDRVHKEGLSEAFIKKYDDFSSIFSSNNNNINNFQIRENNNLHHVSNVLGEDCDSLTIYIIIDSLGYTDFKFIELIKPLDPQPSETKIAFSTVPSYTPCAISSIFTGLLPEETGILGWEVKIGDKSFNLYKKNGFDMEDMIEDNKEKYDFQLFQQKDFNKSGITDFSKSISSIRIEEVDINKDTNTLGEVSERWIKNFEKILKERKEIKEKDYIPPAAKNSIKNKYVFYLPYFDTMLHEKLSVHEFRNYYRVLSNFLSDIISGMKKIIKENLDLNPTIKIFGDHGKLTKTEQKLLSRKFNYSFNKNIFSKRLSLWKRAFLNLDEIDIIDKNGKQSILLSKEKKAIPAERIKDMLKEDLSDNNIEKIKNKVEWEDFLVKGSKFVFGWGGNAEKISELKNMSGIDKWETNEKGVFDTPNLGILSRYINRSSNPRHHGYHGGTSISEMTVPILIYGGD